MKKTIAEQEACEGNRIKLQKIVVTMGGREVNLTVEQARELCALLKGLFGDDSTKIVHVHDHLYYRPWYMGPQWTYTGSNWGATCDTATGTFAVALTNTAGAA